jgi:hypothetical protein
VGAAAVLSLPSFEKLLHLHYLLLSSSPSDSEAEEDPNTNNSNNNSSSGLMALTARKERTYQPTAEE